MNLYNHLNQFCVNLPFAGTVIKKKKEDSNSIESTIVSLRVKSNILKISG